MPTMKFIDEYAVISREAFAQLKQTMSKEEGAAHLANIIITEGYPLPLVPISWADCLDSMNALLELDATSLIKDGAWYSRYEYKYAFTDKYIATSNIGNRASNYFHQEARFHCGSQNAPSPVRVWADRKFLTGALYALWSLNVEEVTSTTLRNAIGMRKYIASQFRPSAAKAVYQHFNSKRILDPCSGWGDRLAGFIGTPSANSYLGIDPNDKLHFNYDDQVVCFHENRLVNTVRGCAEDYQYAPERKFDTIFTSPPYFNIERYTEDATQSFKRYKGFNGWLNGFLFPMLENAWKQLEDNGTMIINISDVYSGHKVNPICDNMNAFISNLEGAVYQGAIGYEMRKRPNSKAAGVGTFCEPMWVWKKVVDKG